MSYPESHACPLCGTKCLIGTVHFCTSEMKTKGGSMRTVNLGRVERQTDLIDKKGGLLVRWSLLDAKEPPVNFAIPAPNDEKPVPEAGKRKKKTAGLSKERPERPPIRSGPGSGVKTRSGPLDRYAVKK